ncbi:MAG TPA: TetR/AcrR family transcriptional regulator [Thermoanaerobaculaceae bacterium]|nr:TetR/AcrR family transcriptional regulator [Thermoanaerobaculaceae bacterium]
MDATRTPLVHHEDSVPGRLMTSAIAVFARKGYAATTVREIVEAAGVTKPALYYHFGSKEGIFLAMMGEAFREFDAAATASLGTMGSSEERILRFLDSMFALILDHLDVMRVLEAIYYGPPQGAPALDFGALHSRFIEVLETLVREGIESGEFRPGDPDDLTWAIAGPFEVVRGMTLSHPEMEFGRDRLARLLRVVFEGVRAGREKESVQ